MAYIDVDLSEFYDDELMEEVKRRELISEDYENLENKIRSIEESVTNLVDAINLKQQNQTNKLIENLIYSVTGRIITIGEWNG